MQGFSGKSAIVTGGSRGIGRAIALELASRKTNVAFNYSSNDEAAQETAKRLEAFGVSVIAQRASMKNDAEISDFVKKVKSQFKSIDFLVNNAGVLRDKSLLFMEKSDWDEVLDINLSGVYRITRSLIGSFLKQRSGNIVNISSTAGISGNPGQTNYSASKAGIIGFSKALAREVAPYNVRVNVVAPGFVETEMVGSLPDKMISQYKNDIPMKRFGGPAEVANVVAFLLSDESSYVTGQVLSVDGGLVI